MRDQNIDRAGELLVIRVRGMFAKMFDVRMVEPSPEAWQFLRGERDITMREMGELAHELGFHIELNFVDRDPPDLAAKDTP